MRSGASRAITPRATAAVLTLAAHVALGVLLLMQDRGAGRPSPTNRAPQVIAITLMPLTTDADPIVPDVVADDEARQPLPQVVRGPRPPEVPPESSRAPVTATAITLPPASTEPDTPAAAPRDAGEWYAQAGELAARFAEAHEAPPPTIGKPLQPMREPCKPRESSFKWKSSGNRTGGSAALTLGWEEPEPDSHLFDDMMAGRRMRSSVPDPNRCD